MFAPSSILTEYLQSDKKIKTLTDTGELVEDAVHAAAVKAFE